ncbi:hypothetical protein HDV00_004343 [Rhizophlyctis rosea]|nr:hypothetical protein HDV00_004343 [Rhizophlyctis rosea]
MAELQSLGTRLFGVAELAGEDGMGGEMEFVGSLRNPSGAETAATVEISTRLEVDDPNPPLHIGRGNDIFHLSVEITQLHFPPGWSILGDDDEVMAYQLVIEVDGEIKVSELLADWVTLSNSNNIRHNFLRCTIPLIGQIEDISAFTDPNSCTAYICLIQQRPGRDSEFVLVAPVDLSAISLTRPVEKVVEVFQAGWYEYDEGADDYVGRPLELNGNAGHVNLVVELRMVKQRGDVIEIEND